MSKCLDAVNHSSSVFEFRRWPRCLYAAVVPFLANTDIEQSQLISVQPYSVVGTREARQLVARVEESPERRNHLAVIYLDLFGEEIERRLERSRD